MHTDSALTHVSFLCPEMRIQYPFTNTQIDVVLEENAKTKSKRHRSKFRQSSNTTSIVEEPSSAISVESAESDLSETKEVPIIDAAEEPVVTATAEDLPGPKPVLIVEVENIQHDKFKKTEEVKVSDLLKEGAVAKLTGAVLILRPPVGAHSRGD